jgi:hypothetical protein
VAGVAERDHRRAVLLRAFDAERGRLRRDRLAEAEAAVEHDEAAAIGDDLRPFAGRHVARLLPLHVARHPRDAVAVVAGEVGAEQVVGDAPGFGLVATVGAEDVGDEGLEAFGADQHRCLGVRHPES